MVIRESYGVSQVAFARMVGEDDNAIARYENGSLQTKAANDRIMLARDHKNFLLLKQRNT